MNARQKNVAQYCDGVRTSRQIAELANDSHKYVQEVALKFDLPRRKRGSSFGPMNGAYQHGRKIDLDGYVLISAPSNHPRIRVRKNRNTGSILEHRCILEQKLGRYLLPTEIVDHIDGLTLHNSPENLRLFENNGKHLKNTISGVKHNVSSLGREKLVLCGSGQTNHQPVDRYFQMKKSGDARLRQILHAMLLLGTSSPYLLGTSHHLKKKGISDLSRSSLIQELEQLYQRWELGPVPSRFL